MRGYQIGHLEGPYIPVLHSALMPRQRQPVRQKISPSFWISWRNPTLTLQTHYPELLGLRLVEDIRSHARNFQQLDAWALRIRMKV